jgi:flagellar capping protein FliD
MALQPQRISSYKNLVKKYNKLVQKMKKYSKSNSTEKNPYPVSKENLFCF